MVTELDIYRLDGAEDSIMEYVPGVDPGSLAEDVSSWLGVKILTKNPYRNAVNSLGGVDTASNLPYIRVHPAHENLLIVCHEVAHALMHYGGFYEGHTVRWLRVYLELFQNYASMGLYDKFMDALRRQGFEVEPEDGLAHDLVRRAEFVSV